MPKLTDNSYSPHDLSGLMPSNLVVEADPPADCSDMYGVVLPDITISGLFPRTIPREIHEQLLEEGIAKYDKLWRRLAK